MCPWVFQIDLKVRYEQQEIGIETAEDNSRHYVRSRRVPNAFLNNPKFHVYAYCYTYFRTTALTGIRFSRY